MANDVVYEVTYKNASGQVLQTATFNARGPLDALHVIIATPSIVPPEGTVDIDVRRVAGGE